MQNVNILTVALIVILTVPMIAGAFQQFSREKIKRSLWNLLDNLSFLLGIILAIYLTRKIFFDHNNSIFQQIYAYIPENIQTFLYGQDVMIYLVSVPFLLLLLIGVLKLLVNWVNNYILEPLSGLLYDFLASDKRLLQPFVGAALQLPRGVFYVFITGLLLNFYVYYFPSPDLSGLMKGSEAYQVLYNEAIYPALNSNIAKKIPVLVNDSFGKISNTSHSEASGDLSPVDLLKKGHIRTIEYFNGVTLDEAVRSNPQIDETARSLTANKQSSSDKAYSLYKWVSENITYDYDKAARVSSNPQGIASGSIVAFNTRRGICFDYSSLYISMCRAVGLKVRLVTGLGYSGIAWGDHAWNQVYLSEKGRWINVDTTFGSNGNYFDKPDFNADHKYGEVQGEW